MKTHLIFIILLLLLLQANIHAQEPWIRLSPVPIESSLKEIIQLPGTNRIMAVGTGASLLYTNDMGENWHISYKPTGVSRFVTFNAIHFVDEAIGYVVGSKATILKTEDGGINWENISPTGTYNILDVFFLSESIGIITRVESIWKTIDGGITWDSVPADGILNNPTQLHFVNDSVGYFSNKWGSVYYKSTDLGESWHQTEINPPIEGLYITAVNFLNEDTGFVSGTVSSMSNIDHYILKTINGGNTWYPVNYNTSIGTHELYFYNDSIGFSVGQQYYGDVFFRTSDGGESWTEVNPACGALHLNSFVFNEEGTGFCVGDRGFINISTDWGLTWECQNEIMLSAGSINTSQVIDDSVVVVGTTGYGGGILYGNIYRSTNGGESWTNIFNIWPVSDLQFLSQDIGWVCCDVFYGEIYHTTNGGNNWQTLTINQWELTTKCLYFINEDIGFVGGDESGNVKIYKTNDGGSNWYETIGNLQIWDYPTDIVFIDDSIGFAVGIVYPFVMLLRTNDQGETWTRDSLNFEVIINQIEFINDSTGFMIGYPNTILKTVDRGLNWYEVSSGIGGYDEFTDINFPSNQIGYITVSGNEVTLLKTLDGGETWFPIDFPCTATVTTIGFFNENEGLAMGSGGIIFKTYTGGIVDIPEFPANIEDNNKLLCYPVPTSNLINVEVEYENQTYPEKVIIYNYSGKKVIDKEILPNQKSIQINISGLKSGIYLIATLSNGNIIRTGKVIKTD